MLSIFYTPWEYSFAQESENLDEVIQGFEEEEELFPGEIITYHAQLTGAHYEHLEGLEITLKVNFKTLEVMEKSPTNILVNTEVIVETEGETRPALIAHWLGLTILENKEKS